MKIKKLKRNGLAYRLWFVGRSAASKIDPDKFEHQKWGTQPTPAIQAAWVAVEQYINSNFRTIKRKRHNPPTPAK